MESNLEEIENIIVKDSNRGMGILREYLPSKYCKEAAEYILSLEKGVIFIATGFYVAGHAETDGPPGALVISLTLKKLGYTPVILTDKYCKDFFEKYDIKVIYMDINIKEENMIENCDNINNQEINKKIKKKRNKKGNNKINEKIEDEKEKEELQFKDIDEILNYINDTTDTKKGKKKYKKGRKNKNKNLIFVVMDYFLFYLINED